MRLRVLALVMVLPLVATAAPKKKRHLASRSTHAQPMVSASPTLSAPVSPPPAVRVAMVTPEAPEPSRLDLAPPTSVAAARDEQLERRSRRWGMMAGGTALFAAAWAADVGVTYGLRHDPQAVSLIPLFGPLIQCGDKYGYQGPMPMTGNPALDKQMAEQIGQANTLVQSVTYVGLALDAAAQLAGLTLAIVGAATHRSEWSKVSATGRGVAVRF